jgi:hypothetical protein
MVQYIDMKDTIAQESPYARRDLNGASGLVVAIIAQAAVDACSNDAALKRDAWCYFAGNLYQQHLGWLGLDDSLLPEGITISTVTTGE